jgi:hypothetical protein
MHDLTPIPELRRLFGDFIDGEIKNELPGMEGRNYHKYGLNVLADFADDTSPARPEAKRIFAERLSNPPPEDLCDNTGLPFGFPGPGLVSEPIKLVQAPRVTMVIYEVGNNYRQIFTDGRTLPAEINLPSYFGYSVGRWDRDTLVVDTVGFNDKVPLDFLGHPRSEQLHITERFRRRDYGHLDTEITYNDPEFYTRPFTIRISYHLLADEDIFEMFSENEKDCAHIRTTQPK